jgi:predicted transcriptional regulator
MVVLMKRETVHYFTEKEEEFANLLIEIGMKKSTAKVLVFLANMTEATSRVMERGLDLRQPEVSIATRYLMEQNWIASRESKAESKGRPVKIYELDRPLHEIMDSIENKKKIEVSKKLAVIQKLREHSI